ncbi:hypothetical protein Tco_1003425 [Tanacetum coccineum]|uniref:Uncharacterized protein n=1 Tax=Tanacetum coccineum TaxID=301880 RepID=A0ABQ5FAY4_9ASTR
MFSIRIHHGGRFHKFSGSQYVDVEVDIFDMVDIEVFYVIDLDEGLYVLACDEDARCLGHISFDDMELDGEAGFGDVAGSNLDNSGLIHDESFRVDDLDLNLNLHLDLNVPQNETCGN